jgi:hypothetical protein
MPYCNRCGAEVNERWALCEKCRKAVAADAARQKAPHAENVRHTVRLPLGRNINIPGLCFGCLSSQFSIRDGLLWDQHGLLIPHTRRTRRFSPLSLLLAPEAALVAAVVGTRTPLGLTIPLCPSCYGQLGPTEQQALREGPGRGSNWEIANRYFAIRLGAVELTIAVGHAALADQLVASNPGAEFVSWNRKASSPPPRKTPVSPKKRADRKDWCPTCHRRIPGPDISDSAKYAKFWGAEQCYECGADLIVPPG